MQYNFTKDDEINIIETFGKSFFIKVKSLIEPLKLKWGISDLELIQSFSANLVFKGMSHLHGEVIMKFGRNQGSFISEVNALKYFSGHSMCQLIDVDFDNIVLLQELIVPGQELALEHQLEKRVNVFCDLFLELHHKHKKQIKCIPGINLDQDYKSYKDWIFRIVDYMENQDHWQKVTMHMLRAKKLYIELSESHPTEVLLHGDFHYYNILKGKGGYKIIDPKGVLGDPIFDIPRYVLNEFWDENDNMKVDETIDQTFSILNQRLNISKDILSKLLYIEGALAICWCIESGADMNKKSDYLETLEKLAMYIKKYSQT